MEIILIALVITIYLIKLSKNITPDTKIKNTKIKQRPKPRTYRPGQLKKKLIISQESKVDPITWEPFVICEYCGSENRKEVRCCK